MSEKPESTTIADHVVIVKVSHAPIEGMPVSSGSGNPSFSSLLDILSDKPLRTLDPRLRDE